MSEYGLYSSEHERDACGVGFVANINGEKSHLIIERGIEVLKNLLHRGGVGGDDKTGDGAGILFQLPDAFLRKACGEIGIELPGEGSYGVGMCFLPHDRASNAKCIAIADQVAAAEGVTVLGWRDVAIDANAVELWRTLISITSLPTWFSGAKLIRVYRPKADCRSSDRFCQPHRNQPARNRSREPPG